ncbi:Uncharacterised protein [Mycobacteroides abscessus subsp. abscessus]|nr:Uncharacterised protein [Mycobacteroides abscessus subsp. abscessus]
MIVIARWAALRSGMGSSNFTATGWPTPTVSPFDGVRYACVRLAGARVVNETRLVLVPPMPLASACTV